ncbi:hypothetical protein ACIBG8_46875 [Nonomuraea sp. NPDC050556]|uniref:hypothetical protein n=1 Tax=Nonomuraea sp. NPDC050556 TaxID=3364369 RepID=UPI0037B919D6
MDNPRLVSRSTLTEDPAVTHAMQTYDQFSPRQQREVFISLYRAIRAFRRTGDTDFLATFAQSVEAMITLHSRPDVREAIRNANPSPRRADQLIDVDHVTQHLHA